MIEEQQHKQIRGQKQVSTTIAPELTKKRRSEMDVKIIILNAIADGESSLTHIMYRSNTSWGATTRFVKVLEIQKLIAFDFVGDRKRYYLTEKGIRVLQTYTSIASQLVTQPGTSSQASR